MPNAHHIEILEQGVDAWNAWRAKEHSVRPDLSGVDLSGANLAGANLSETKLGASILIRANLCKANLFGADLIGANLADADLRCADLTWAKLIEAVLSNARLHQAILHGADLSAADFGEAELPGADLSNAVMVGTNFTNADLTGCSVFGISAWKLVLSKGTKQQNLVIKQPPEGADGPPEPDITVDNIEVAQFIYLLLHNEKIRDVIDTIGKKGVLLLGRFTGGRIVVLERLREELRKRDFVPMIFNFDKPETKNFSETIRLLAGMSRFVIADITNPRSAPLELQATVPECMVPVVPILDKTEELKPFSMLEDLQIAHPDRVLDVILYPSVDRLVEMFDAEIINPVQARFADLLARKGGGIRVKDIS